MACSYQNRKKLRSPAALTFWGIHKKRHIDQCFLDRPEDFLPDWFLEAVDLAPLVDAHDGAPQLTDEELRRQEINKHEYLSALAALGKPLWGDLTPNAAWLQALESLEPEVPKVEFGTWLKGTRLAGIDGNILLIKANNPYHEKFLQARLARLETFLAALTSQPITLEICD
jgi:hypothetical protein